MGTRGPIPKRSTERAGHRTKSEAPGRVAMNGAVPVPSAFREWHPRARSWYRSLARSGQSRFYEASDWEYARVLADLLSRQLSSGRPSSEMMKAIFAGMDSLGTTEGARRRMRIEVERPEADDAADDAEVAVMEQYRRVSGG